MSREPHPGFLCGLRKMFLGAVPGPLAAVLLAACGLNEIEMPENPCTAPLRSPGTKLPVNWENPVMGQLSLYRRFSFEGDSLGFTRDTLLAVVDALYPDSFRIVERVCPEAYLAPNANGIRDIVLERKDSILRLSGYSEILPYTGSEGLDLRPQGPFLSLRDLARADGGILPGYGRIAGFTLGMRSYDTVSVRVERSSSFNFWIYTARDGLLLKAVVGTWGNSGWGRAD